MPKTTTDYNRLPLTDWFYSIEHTKLSPGWMAWMDGMDISLTPPTTRAPLAVLKISDDDHQVLIKAAHVIPIT